MYIASLRENSRKLLVFLLCNLFAVFLRIFLISDHFSDVFQMNVNLYPTFNKT